MHIISSRKDLEISIPQQTIKHRRFTTKDPLLISKNLPTRRFVSSITITNDSFIEQFLNIYPFNSHNILCEKANHCARSKFSISAKLTQRLSRKFYHIDQRVMKMQRVLSRKQSASRLENISHTSFPTFIHLYTHLRNVSLIK